MSAAPEPPPILSVVVPCFDRMELLARSLAAIADQRLPGGQGFEIVVADNHPDSPARALAARFGAVHVAAAPHRNIAAARNRGVAAARGRYIAFIDDDEAPEPGCLAAHLALLERSGADASFGPKEPAFETGAPPDWDPEGHYFRTDLGLPEGAVLDPLAWWHGGGRGMGAGNSMMRRATCLAGPAPFDEVLGRAGGEDTELLFRLARQGRRFLWCPAARVVEMNLAGRLSADYMRARLGRSARHGAIHRVRSARWPWLTRLAVWTLGLGQAAVHGALWALTAGGPPARRMRHRFGVAKGLGKLGLGTGLDFVREG
ncbi:glycosyltransferase family 2 protein [Rubritepida flocculans]|jgi:glycosyltransferase involved in cell wall biosynthesis|uniref:glycosyltransferase family 2 protein n=1 Tax=Rubritepida flocculans TaxID=182403 RepID=UPI0003FD2384|nr:glycosyltransferase family 2 protein [Rubritepida flocculans]